MKISLNNPDITPMWFLLGTDIALTFESPGPVNINEKDLTDLQLAEIKKAAFSQKIKIEGNELVSKELSLEQLLERQRFAKIEKYRNYLSQKLSVLKKDLSSQSISDLRGILEEEKLGKARKSVLQLIEKLISEHQRKVFNAVGKESVNPQTPQDYKDIFGKLNKIYQNNISMIEESDIEEFEIVIGE